MIPLINLLNELECYLQDDIGQLMKEGFKDRPGSTIDNLHKLLDGCIEWQQKLKTEELIINTKRNSERLYNQLKNSI